MSHDSQNGTILHGRQHIGRIAPPLHNLFALLIGVENYPEVSPSTGIEPSSDDTKVTPAYWPRVVGDDEAPENPDGALVDVENMYDYLVNERGVPVENIVTLRDSQATRAEILRAFRGHLIENSQINWGDPILFHYSGHGTRGPAPIGWASAGDGEDPRIEYIVPYDSVSYGQEGKPGIPDRTLRALLADLARRKGKNITVVFDSCHSAHGTRSWISNKGRYRKRSINCKYVGKATPDTDRDIWDATHVTGSAMSESVSKDNFADDTHVLLAGCERDDSSSGSKEGGLFTSMLIGALREGRAKTYGELMERVHETLGVFYHQINAYYDACDPPTPKDQRISLQSPQCEGLGRNRYLFSDATDDARTFAIRPHTTDTTLCIIQGAGAPLRIKVGTVFELRHASHGKVAEGVLGTVVVTEVEQARCVARLPPGVVIQPNSYVRAFLSKLADPIALAAINLEPGSEKAKAAYDHLMLCLSEPSQHFTFVTEENADLVLRVDEKNVHFRRKDDRLGSLDLPDPFVKNADIPTLFPGVLARIAHFNYYVSLEGPNEDKHPLANQVSVHLHRLAPAAADYYADDFTFSDVYLNPAKDGEVPFVDEEATVIYNESEEELYALELKNSGDQALHPYVFILDPSSYAIQLFAQPINTEQPALPAASSSEGRVQIGKSAACDSALWFAPREDGSKDTGFLKVILATEGGLKLDYIAQDPVLGYDPDTDQPCYVGARDMPAEEKASAKPMKGAWDVITRKFSVVSQ